MKDDPNYDMKPFYHFLDTVVDEYGLYLFMAFVFACPFNHLVGSPVGSKAS